MGGIYECKEELNEAGHQLKPMVVEAVEVKRRQNGKVPLWRGNHEAMLD